MRFPLYLLLGLLLVGSVLACKEKYDINENIIIIDVIESSGMNASCTITVYDGNSTLDVQNMSRNGLVYTYNGSPLNPGVYTSDISCTHNSSLYQSECKFEVEGTKMIWILAVALGFAFALFALGIYKEDEHMVGLASIIGMGIGVFTLINGIDGYDNLITLSLGVVLIGLGAYAFIRVYLESAIRTYDKLD